MKDSLPATDPVPREEFEQFLHVFIHEIRNRLNGLALEAADLAEQAGAQADATRLQGQIQACSAFLKATRESVAPDDPVAERVALAALMKNWRERKSGAD